MEARETRGWSRGCSTPSSAMSLRQSSGGVWSPVQSPGVTAGLQAFPGGHHPASPGSREAGRLQNRESRGPDADPEQGGITASGPWAGTRRPHRIPARCGRHRDGGRRVTAFRNQNPVWVLGEGGTLHALTLKAEASAGWAGNPDPTVQKGNCHAQVVTQVRLPSSAPARARTTHMQKGGGTGHGGRTGMGWAGADHREGPREGTVMGVG